MARLWIPVTGSRVAPPDWTRAQVPDGSAGSSAAAYAIAGHAPTDSPRIVSLVLSSPGGPSLGEALGASEADSLGDPLGRGRRGRRTVGVGFGAVVLAAGAEEGQREEGAGRGGGTSGAHGGETLAVAPGLSGDIG